MSEVSVHMIMSHRDEGGSNDRGVVSSGRIGKEIILYI